ncbi:carboxylesterase/lipase family protein [Bifidobacterium callimiconis]|uniref:Carboxylic ester hydrolase n=1 Tax=Bifidobacterium callimiconis TaxID=2306973 RepID=A0A430FBE0_9BIFI|nr:carboxylesterase family protein [Bifidobacterium callimiconis]RSX50157.1 carboxylesterase [Bifidobacterium callimiconis]
MPQTFLYEPLTPAPVVQTTHGKVQGRWQNATSAAYLGIPFAAAPFGEHRFTAPVDPEPWDGVRQTVDYGPTPQRRPFGDLVTIPEPSIPGESVLNVNVFTPAPRDRSAKLPVLVWIHGGGWFAGSPASPWYNGSTFNARGIVTVTVSYRLGFDGFGWMDGAPLNRGTLDQIKALEWVRDNIAAFGGDPDRVTIAGQSAGGGNVMVLASSPKARGLFRSVISESGSFGTPTVADAMIGGRKLAERLGVKPTIDGFRTVDHDTILDNERKTNHTEGVPSAVLDADTLLGVLRDGLLDKNGMIYVPVVDGEVLTRPIAASQTAGAGNDVSVLMGTTRNEMKFSMPNGPTLADTVSAFKTAGLSDDAIGHFTAEIDKLDGEEYIPGQIMTTMTFSVGLASIAAARRAAGVGDRTWLYDFAQQSSTDNACTHCADIPYFFGNLDAVKVEQVLGHHPSQYLASVMNGLWAEFIATGRLSRPTVDDHPYGAIRLQGDATYDPEAYRFPYELLTHAAAQ